jgi:hypothetical protein
MAATTPDPQTLRLWLLLSLLGAFLAVVGWIRALL